MTKLGTLGLSAVVATAAFSILCCSANAQQAPAAPATPAVTKPATPPAAKAPAATTAAKPAPKPSPCKGLDETSCKAKAACTYVVPTATNATTGKVASPYCKLAAKKAATPKAPAAAKPVAAAAAKPAAPAAAAPAAAPKQ